jgi:hypothetical protein
MTIIARSGAGVAVLALAVAAMSAPPGGGGGGGDGGGNGNGGGNAQAPRFFVATPGFANPRDAVHADVLIDRVVYPDGTTIETDRFIFPADVVDMSYAGPIRAFRTMNGPDATVGIPGVAYIEAQDGVPGNISLQDRLLFCDRVEATLGNVNLNDRVHLAAQTSYGFVVSLGTRVWDNSFSLDERPELFIFEEQGNSVLTVQALGDQLQPVGTPVEIRAVDIRSIQPTKVWVGRFGNNGLPQSGTYELKVASIDLNSLGVTSVKYLRITNAVTGGGEMSTDFKLLAIDTSPAEAAQTMAFD